MSSFTRMMEDYDYHQHTGELPEYFGGRKDDNRGCGFGCFVAIILLAGILYSTCGSDRKDEPKHQQKQELVSEPVPLYQIPYTPAETSTVPETSVAKQEETPKVEQTSPQQHSQPEKKIKISCYYEEGYEKGYDDGEDDAVMDNGWGGQFDDECRYTGWKKKDYQLGYEEGYEAGYYDNKDSDE